MLAVRAIDASMSTIIFFSFAESIENSYFSRLFSRTAVFLASGAYQLAALTAPTTIHRRAHR
jgi:hypothetical protein